MSSLQELVARARAQTTELRETLKELASIEIETPTHTVPEIERALATLHAIKNGYVLTEVLDPKMQEYMDGKIEGLEVSIEALEGRGATRKRGGKRPKAPAVAKSSSIFDVTSDEQIAKAMPKDEPTPHAMDLQGDGGKGKLAVLAAIGECAEIGATPAHLSLLTPYKARSISNYLVMLKSDGCIEKTGTHYRTTGRGQNELVRVGFVRTPILKRLSSGERLIIESIKRGGARGVTKGMLTLDTKYKRRSVDNYVVMLGTRELVETRDKRIHLTSLGAGATSALKPEALKLSEGEEIVFEAITMNKGGVTKAELVEMLADNYKRRSIDNYLVMLGTRELITKTDGKYQRRKD